MTACYKYIFLDITAICIKVVDHRLANLANIKADKALQRAEWL